MLQFGRLTRAGLDIRRRRITRREISLAVALAGVPLLSSGPLWTSLLLVIVASLGTASWRLACVLCASVLPTVLGAPWPTHCFAAAGMWMLTGHEWRALLSGGRVALGLRRMAFIGGSGIIAGLGVVVLDHQRIFAGITLPGHRPQPVLLALVVVGLAFVNASGEELLWRGILESETTGSGARWRVALHMASFGVAHWHGIPSGIVGMLAAGAYSGFLYRVRRDAGFVSALAVHVVTDIVIFWVVARYAFFRWTG